MGAKAYSAVQRGASLMLAFRPQVTLIIGSGHLAATRAFSALESSSSVIIFSKGGIDRACEELRYRADNGELHIREFSCSSAAVEDSDVAAIESFLDNEAAGNVSLVFVTDTMISLEGSCRRTAESANLLRQACRKRHIPVNVTDIPDLCDFTVCATHRLADSEGNATALQIGVTTNGKGCRLSSRIKRELVAKLPAEAGAAVEKIGRLRNMAKNSTTGGADAEVELNEEMSVSSPNRPVDQINGNEEESEAERARRRMKWVAQISEYWPITRLAALSEHDMTDLLSGDLRTGSLSVPSTIAPGLTSQHDLDLSPPTRESGRVFLVGSGPGHPALLTLAAHHALTCAADLVLSDKLVPAAILALVPPHVEVRVARKFPGNADGAQQELLDMALAAAREGRTVVRLKQGDPAMYGRVGEEVLFLRAHGVHAVVVPGVSSALAAPLFAGIPVTQRGAADSLAVCTGVGRGGSPALLPGYSRSRTLVVLMGNARLKSVVENLLSGGTESGTKVPYPPCIPAAIIERASMPDQRVISASLRDIVEALDSSGEQRPPGLLVVGWAVLSLWAEGDMTVLNDAEDDYRARDEERVGKWLDGRRWRVSEGLEPLWDLFDV